MPQKLGFAPKVLVLSNRPTTGPLRAFRLQQEKLIAYFKLK
jgi:hypothetical protein